MDCYTSPATPDKAPDSAQKLVRTPLPAPGRSAPSCPTLTVLWQEVVKSAQTPRLVIHGHC